MYRQWMDREIRPYYTQEYSIAMKRCPDVELELICANEDVLGLEKTCEMLATYRKLMEDYPDRTIIQDPEDYDDEYVYKEVSFCVTREELKEFQKILADRRIEVDIIHDE